MGGEYGWGCVGGKVKCGGMGIGICGFECGIWGLSDQGDGGEDVVGGNSEPD